AGATDTNSFSVTAPPVNQAPTVNAGADQSATIGQSLQLSGTVVEDGLPVPPGAYTVLWTRVSGPSTPTWPLNDANMPTTHVVFPVAGTYVMRLTANDSVLTGSDDVSVTVVGAPNAPPTASFTTTPSSGPAPLSVTVDGTASSDSDGVITSYSWNFGDGTPSASGVTATHLYANPG